MIDRRLEQCLQVLTLALNVGVLIMDAAVYDDNRLTQSEREAMENINRSAAITGDLIRHLLGEESSFSSGF